MRRRFLWRLRLSWRVMRSTRLFWTKSESLRSFWPPFSNGSGDRGLAALPPRGVRDRNAPVAHEVADLGRRLGHDYPRARGELDDRVGVRLVGHDQVGIEMEGLWLAEAMELDHCCGPPSGGRRGRERRAQGLLSAPCPLRPAPYALATGSNSPGPEASGRPC